jgi:hypothetical protein
MRPVPTSPMTSISASIVPCQSGVTTFAGAPVGTSQLVSRMPTAPLSNSTSAQQPSGYRSPEGCLSIACTLVIGLLAYQSRRSIGGLGSRQPALLRQVELNGSHQLLDLKFPRSDTLDFEHDLGGGLNGKGGFAAVVADLVD